MSQKLVTYFPLLAIALSSIAFFYPEGFIALQPAIIPLLASIMFSMGLTLTWRHFQAAARQPLVVGIGIAVQYLFMPLFAWLSAMLWRLPMEQLVGMVLVGSSAGGTASNVICYLARGNVALSILMTMTSTLCAVIFMPFLVYLYLHQSIPVPMADMMRSILFIVLLPVVLGTTLNSLFPGRLKKIEAAFPIVSSIAIMIIIAIIVALNRQNLAFLSLPVLGAVILHNLLGLITGYGIPRLLKFDPITCRTVCIEVGMQNSGLSVALAIKYFSPLAALPGALFSIWHNLSGIMLAACWRKADGK